MTLDVIAAGTGYISAAGTDSSNPMVGVILKATLGNNHSFASQSASAGEQQRQNVGQAQNTNRDIGI